MTGSGEALLGETWCRFKHHCCRDHEHEKKMAERNGRNTGKEERKKD